MSTVGYRTRSRAQQACLSGTLRLRLVLTGPGSPAPTALKAQQEAGPNQAIWQRCSPQRCQRTKMPAWQRRP